MGLKFIIAEAQNRVTQASQVSSHTQQGITSLQQSIQRFLSAPLSSTAYDSAKSYFLLAYTPLCQSVILTTEALQEAHKKFLSEFQAFSGIDLDEEQLQQEIDQYQQLLETIDEMIRDAKTPRPDLERRATNAYEAKQKRQEKLDNFREYNSRSAGFFAEYEACQQELNQGLAQVKDSKAWNPATGTFDMNRLDMSWAKPINERWKAREDKNAVYDIKMLMDEFGNPVYEIYRNGKLDSDLTIEYAALMAELRMRGLDEFMNSPAGKLYTTIISVVTMLNGAKVIFKGIYELGKGISLAYGVNATTGQPVYALVQADGLVISDVVSSVSAGVAQAITGVAVNAFDSSLLGANGTQTTSNTLWRNGSTERIDVENPKPGQRDGDVHYHEPNNTKWRYDVKSKKFIDEESGELAPKRIQKLLKNPKIQKAIEKALKILGL